MSRAFNKQYYIDYIKLCVSVDLIELEIPDETIGKFVDAALVELQRYIDLPKLITVPYAPCIDLKGWKHDSIINVYRSEGVTGDSSSAAMGSNVDPLYAEKWMVFSNGGLLYNLQNYFMNYLSYNTLLQMQNTCSTDMKWKEDKHENKLYINSSFDIPKSVTIEYIPIYDDVELINDDYWIDILKRLSLALTKVGLGRLRTYVTQSNALWGLDGERLLTEGNEELKELRETLRSNSMMFLPVD